MARQHGRNGQVYLAVTSGAAASPVAFQATWSVSITTEKYDVTTLADSQKVYAAGLPEISGDFSGFLDAGTSQTYVAASDGLPRAFCLYPDAVNSPAVFFAGTVIADFAGGGASGGPVTVSAAWDAGAGVQRFPAGDGSGAAAIAAAAAAAAQAVQAAKATAAASGSVTAAGGPPAGPPGALFPSVPGRAVPGQFTPGEPGAPVTGLLDEAAAADVTDEGGGIIANEDGS